MGWRRLRKRPALLHREGLESDRLNYGVIMPYQNNFIHFIPRGIVYFHQRLSQRWGAAIGLLILCLAPLARGQALSSVTYTGSAGGVIGNNPFSGQDIDAPGTATGMVNDGACSGTATLSLIGGSPNEIEATANGLGMSEYFYINAGGSINGSFVVEGASPMQVPIVFLASGTASGNDGIYVESQASFGAEDEIGPIVSGDANYANSSFSLNQSVLIPATVIVYVSVNASAQVTTGNYGQSSYPPVSGSANATVDPQIYIDPAFLATNSNYYIEFAPDYFFSAANIASFQVASGTNLVINATNGIPGTMYSVMTTTNVALPLSQWKVVSTNNLWRVLGAATITATNAVSPAARQQFFVLKMQ